MIIIMITKHVIIITIIHVVVLSNNNNKETSCVPSTVHLRRNVFGQVRLAKTKIRLRILAVWSQTSLGTFWIAKDRQFLHAHNEDSD